MEKMAAETVIDSDRVSPTGGRRSGIERREFSFTAFAPERRSGKDRRNSKDRRLKPRVMSMIQKIKEKLHENE